MLGAGMGVESGQMVAGCPEVRGIDGKCKLIASARQTQGGALESKLGASNFKYHRATSCPS